MSLDAAADELYSRSRGLGLRLVLGVGLVNRGRNSCFQAMLQPDSMKAETTSLPGSRRNPLEVFTSMFR